MTDTLNSRVAGNIRAELARRGTTHEQLGQTLGVTRQAISKRLDGSSKLTLDEIERIAAAIQIDPVKLLTTD